METALRVIAFGARGVSRGAWRLADRVESSRAIAFNSLAVLSLVTVALVIERFTRPNEH